MRAEDLDANMSKISEDKHLGIWRGPNVYSYFDTRIVRPKISENDWPQDIESEVLEMRCSLKHLKDDLR